MQKSLWSRLDWVNVSFLLLTPLAALSLTPLHIYLNGLRWELLAFFFVYSLVTSLSVTAGYHRLFAHRSYEAKPWVRFLLLVFGAAAFQNSALKWCSDHRRHHRDVDTETDPYNIQRGFFYAHMGWILLKEDPKFKDQFAPDLAADPMMQWQHRNIFKIGAVSGFLFPTLIGWAMGSPIGGLIYGGLLRVVFTHHCTFLINSLCHTFGRQPYTDENSARDSFLMAIFTYGEGYHNFHHKFQIDYRNGVRWYQWDPTKWVIATLSWIGQTYSLRRVSNVEIIKAQMTFQEKRLTARGVATEKLAQLRARTEEAQRRAKHLLEEYRQLKADFKSYNVQAQFEASYLDKKLRLQTEIKLCKLEFRAAHKQWSTYCAMLWKSMAPPQIAG